MLLAEKNRVPPAGQPSVAVRIRTKQKINNSPVVRYRDGQKIARMARAVPSFHKKTPIFR
jgi:hypothetical protein